MKTSSFSRNKVRLRQARNSNNIFSAFYLTKIDRLIEYETFNFR